MKNLIERLIEEADLLDKALDFMSDPDLRAESAASVTLLRETTSALRETISALESIKSHWLAVRPSGLDSTYEIPGLTDAEEAEYRAHVAALDRLTAQSPSLSARPGVGGEADVGRGA